MCVACSLIDVSLSDDRDTNDQGGCLLGFRWSTNDKGGLDPERGTQMQRHRLRLYGLIVSAVGLTSLYIVPIASAHTAWC